MEPDAIKNAIAAKKGAPYEPKKVQGDVRALMKLGFFSDVTVEREGTPNAPVLVYRVVERPAMQSDERRGTRNLEEGPQTRPSP